MFRPVEMQKIMLLATKDSENRLISALNKLGMVEIRTLNIEGLEKGRPLEVHDALSYELIRIRSLISIFDLQPFLSLKKNKYSVKDTIDYDTVLKNAKKIDIETELKSLVESRNKLNSELSEIKKKKTELSALASFSELDFSKLETKNFAFVIGTLKNKLFSGFKKDLEEYLGNEKVILYSDLKKETKVVLIFYPKKENISFILSRYNFEAINLPENFSNYENGIKNLETKLSETEKNKQEIEKRILGLGNEYWEKLIELEKELRILTNRAAIATNFASGKKIIAIDGWIKKRDFEFLDQMLKTEFSKETEIIEIKNPEKDVPIALDNPKKIKQFQWLVEFYALPHYNEFDPTFILLFTVPIIYGMMVGDVGYGIFSIFLSALILKKFKKGMLNNVAKIWLFSSISAIIFGIVFDEWFGFTHMGLISWLNEWGANIAITAPIYEGLSRAHNLNLIIGLSLLVGVIHLSLGFILGAINNWQHDKKHAIAKIAWLVFLLSSSVAAASFIFNLISKEIGEVSLGFVALSTVVIVYLDRLVGFFEIPGLAANVFSYARIAAVGASGVIIAEIINHNFLPTGSEGIILLPIFIILHILNTMLAMFESIVQGGRLNFVEFYSKFFHGGGKEFAPFKIED